MSPVVKGVAGVGIPAAGAGGAYVLLKNGDKIEKMPEFIALSSTNTDAYVKDYKPYFVDKDDEKNNAWWNWSYRNKLLEDRKSNKELSSEFQSVSDMQGMKAGCSTAYNKQENDFTSQSADANTKKLLNDLWRFCSIFDRKPKTIEDNNVDGSEDNILLEDGSKGYKDKLGSNNKESLVSTNYKSRENDQFWALRDIEFFGKEKVQGIGHYSNETVQQKNMFHKLFDEEKRGGLKATCDEAYRWDNNNSSGTSPAVAVDDLIKFCGLKVKNSN